MKTVFFLPLDSGKILLYAPYHGLRAVINEAARDALESSGEGAEDLRRLLSEAPEIPTVRSGPLKEPMFLGLIPTRGCNLGCAYCDFAALKSQPTMTDSMVRKAVDAYVNLLRENDVSHGAIHCFGGEPLAAFDTIRFAVEYARAKDLPIHFEVTTNGFCSEYQAEWVGANIDTVVLSFDGFPAIQDRQRGTIGGKGSFDIVSRSAVIFSEMDCEFIVRSCVTSDSVRMLPQWADWLARSFSPEAVCFEPMLESPLARSAGLHPPAAEDFIYFWEESFRILREYEIPLVFASADISSTRASLCPLGQDTMIITPSGRITGCWQLEENQQPDLSLGYLTDDGFSIPEEAPDRLRQLCEVNRSVCEDCFCYAHCAGGCLLNHNTASGKSEYFCRLTRELTKWQLLESLEPTAPAPLEKISLPLYSRSMGEHLQIRNGRDCIRFDLTEGPAHV